MTFIMFFYSLLDILVCKFTSSFSIKKEVFLQKLLYPIFYELHKIVINKPLFIHYSLNCVVKYFFNQCNSKNVKSTSLVNLQYVVKLIKSVFENNITYMLYTVTYIKCITFYD